MLITHFSLIRWINLSSVANIIESTMDSRRFILQYLAATVILGSLGIFAIQTRLDAPTIVFYRCLFGAIALGIYCLCAGDFRSISKRDLYVALATGVLMVGNWVFFFEGILRIGISVATIVYQVQPFAVLVAGALIFRERLGLTQILLFLTALIGLVLATGVQWSRVDKEYLTGFGVTMTAAILYAGVVLTGKSLKSIRPTAVTFIQCVVGVISLPIIDPFILHTPIAAHRVAWLAGLGVIHTALVYALIYGALPKLNSSVIAIMTFIYPASAILFDFLVNRKILSVSQFLGLAIIVFSSTGITCGWKLPQLGKRLESVCQVY